MKREEVEALFKLADIPVEKIWEISNKYWPDTPQYTDIRRNNPWWLVKTIPYGMFEIGWRKRVIQIDWSDTGKYTTVTADDVTKNGTMVHAWSYAKAVEYLTEWKKQVIFSAIEVSDE